MSNVPEQTTLENGELSFPSFYEGWHLRQQDFLNELITAQRNYTQYSSLSTEDEDYLTGLITRVLLHHQQFFEAKSRISQRDIFLVFSPTWFTTLEHSFLWISGFQPSLALKIVSDSVDDLSDNQMRELTQLTHDTKVAQEELDHKFANRQERIARPEISWALREIGRRPMDDNLTEEESMMLWVSTGIKWVVEKADTLRRGTTLKAMRLLNPLQNVKFLTAATEYQMRIRSRGLEMDAQRVE